jgi:hypothetical protein
MSLFTVIDCEQRSPEWYSARAGRVTASRASAVLAKGKNGAEAATRADYKLQLVTERMTGRPQEDDFTNVHIQRGIELEPAARGEYEVLTGDVVHQCGFLLLNGWEAGASLDGYIDNFRGIVSFKCPKSTTHIDYLKRRRLPPEYVPQATHEMWVTGAEFYDFCSYDDRVPEGLQLFHVRVERSELKAELEAYEHEVARFLNEVDAEVKLLTKLRRAA